MPSRTSIIVVYTAVIASNSWVFIQVIIQHVIKSYCYLLLILTTCIIIFMLVS